MKDITVSKQDWIQAARTATTNRRQAAAMTFYDQIVDAINALKDEMEIGYGALPYMPIIQEMFKEKDFIVQRIEDRSANKIRLRITHREQGVS